MPQLRVALAQLNVTVGDLDGNAEKIVTWTRNAVERGAHVVAFPELALTGYPVEDLALRRSFVDASQARVEELAQRLQDEGLGETVVVCGYLGRATGTAMGVDRLGRPKGSPTNSAAVIHRGAVVTSAVKHHLPNYGVFDEFRHFVPGNTLQVIRIHGIDVALVICEDLWQDGGPVAVTRAAGAGLLLVVNSSPYEANKDDVRGELVSRRAREAGCSLAYVNLIGGQDELVFDGDSLIVDAEGKTLARAPQFEQGGMVVDLELPAATATPKGEHEGIEIVHTVLHEDPLPAYEPIAAAQAPRLADEAEMYGAIVLGLRDYVQKNGFKSVLLGLSGGIDSSLVAAIACDAIGAKHVFGISNPSVYSSDHSRDDAAELAARTGLNYRVVPIQPMVQPFLDTLGLTGLAEENLQARVRAVIWMGLSNADGHLVLACGNKSELSVGYSTIYGDAVGGYAPLKDVPKTLVWRLAKWRNADAKARGQQPPIPENSIAKPPSAELRPGQQDTDSLPPYELLDDMLDDYVEQDRGSAELVAAGFDPELASKVIQLVDKAEYKRRQYPPGPKITHKAFGRDRRLPITTAWREDARKAAGN
ncbi:NAD+ synthase (glutamine-hydrolysing) [Kribbella sp. VKM Ac-2527]|uniref:Glutamine-dependent NAD(+) synthetase n=1 Tax=Kribbella caucasensis TaxID=2512215 RepID=A0A4R6JCK4_9ACTN|nr:NAD+ synthase [Kribbella sp. VKM Ac-2527]TDO33479.1 NAD+ synthase (glutamine-hydrolysing) [Kribbella sp. VKM Ac-2527]